jgi:hypothetical protein
VFFFNLVDDELLKMKSRNNNTLTILVVIVFCGNVECGPAKTTI